MGKKKPNVDTTFVDSRGATLYYRNGKLHRDDGPAVIHRNGDQEWYLNGRLHRDNDLPAAEFANGSKTWYCKGKRHRVGGPAVLFLNGDAIWFQNGKHHRTDGPAFDARGIKEWYLDGKRYKEAAFNAEMKRRNDPLYNAIIPINGTQYRLTPL